MELPLQPAVVNTDIQALGGRGGSMYCAVSTNMDMSMPLSWSHQSPIRHSSLRFSITYLTI